MPELGWEYSYPLAWLLTLGGTGAMWWWLKKKNLF
jgi:Mg2+ and Co2+ transporter CorA